MTATDPRSAPPPGSGAGAPGASGRVRRVLLVGAAIVALGMVNAAVSHQRQADDAFIFYRYVDNLLRGYGLTWNRGGERVEGYTSFLYVVLLIVPRWLAAPPALAANVINGVLFALTSLGSTSLLRTVVGRWTPTVLLGPFLVASSAVLGVASRNGMESMLFAFLVVASLDAHFRATTPRAALFSGVLFGLATLARPEGALLYAVAAAHGALVRRGNGQPLLDRLEGQRLVALAAVVLPHLAFRHAYYGEWFPNTYYAKLGHGALWMFKTGLWGLHACLKARMGAVIALALPLHLLAPRSPRADLIAALFLIWIAWLVRMGLDDWFYWYVVPVHLLSLLVAARALGEMIRRPAEGASTIVAVVAALLAVATPGALDPPPATDAVGMALYGLRAAFTLLVVALAAARVMRRRRPTARATASLAWGAFTAVLGYHALYCVVLRGAQVASFSAVAAKLKEIAAPDETIATGACGEIPYVTDLVTYDTLGLNDKHIAHEPMPDRKYGGFGHDRGDGPYILAQRPSYLIPVPYATPKPRRGPNFEKTFIEIFATPGLEEDYEFRSLELGDGRWFSFYKRKSGR